MADQTLHVGTYELHERRGYVVVTDVETGDEIGRITAAGLSELAYKADRSDGDAS